MAIVKSEELSRPDFLISGVTIRDAPIIGISRLVRWYRLIFIYTIGRDIKQS